MYTGFVENLLAGLAIHPVFTLTRLFSVCIWVILEVSPPTAVTLAIAIELF